jgi:flagellar basal-body rod protein FlgF
MSYRQSSFSTERFMGAPVRPASNTNNLANTQTTGFKSDFEQFRSMPVFGPGHPPRVYAMTERPGTDLSTGPIQTTGRV